MWIFLIGLSGEIIDVTSLSDINEFILTCLEISLLFQVLWKTVFSVVLLYSPVLQGRGHQKQLRNVILKKFLGLFQ